MRFVTPQEAAYVLRCTRQAVWTWIKDGTLPAFQVTENGKHCIDLAKFLSNKGIDPKPYIEYLDKMKEEITEE